MTLRCEDLRKSFHTTAEKVEVLRGVSFTVAEGESVAIVGSSGSGKTTLLSIIAGLEPADSGSIWLRETNFSALSQKDQTRERGLRMGLIFQSYHLIPHLTALENVCLPLEIQGLPSGQVVNRARELLEQVGLTHRENHFPTTLSGGEKQRVAIARALIGQPNLLLADEPSGSLDTQNGMTVSRLLFDLVSNKKQALILVTHDLELAAKCQRVLKLVSGQLVA